MSYCDDFPAHVVVEPVDTVGVYEAVSHPHTSLHRLINLSHHIKRFLNPVLSDLFPIALGFFHGLRVVFQDKERLVCSDTTQLSILTPVHLQVNQVLSVSHKPCFSLI